MRKQNWEISHRYNTMHDKWIVKERTDLANYYNPYLKLRYNVTSTSEATALISEGQLANLEEIIIDGKKIEDFNQFISTTLNQVIYSAYIFNSIGEHNIWFKFTDKALAYLENTYVGGFGSSTPITEIVEIPTDLIQLVNGAFFLCDTIVKANLYTPNGKLTTITSGAFGNCTGLTELIIPNSVEIIQGSSFYGCTGIERLVLSSSMTTIEPGNWNGNTNLREVIIPEGIEKINGGAFYKCTGLKNIVIPSTIAEIQGGAFSDSGLTEIICKSTTAPIISDTGGSFSGVPSNGTLYVPYGCTEAYSAWMEDPYLGGKGWTIQELPKE